MLNMEKKPHPVNKKEELIQKWEYVKCDFCNSNNFNIVFKTKDYIFNKAPDQYSIVKCKNCSLVYINPQLNSEIIENYYSEIVQYDNRIIETNKDYRLNIFSHKDILTNFFNYPFFKKKRIVKLIQYPNFLRVRRKWRKTYLIPPYKKNGNILNIGCSYGGFLYQLRNLGWNVQGIELNKEAADYGVEKYNLDIKNQSIEEFQPDIQFDIIYLQMVLEHVKSPKVILEKCYSLLKSDGVLVISVPDFSGIEVQIYKKYAYTLHAPFHLYQFTPRTIKNYLKAGHFKNIKITHQNFDRDLVAPLNFILRENPNSFFIKILYKLSYNKFIKKTIVRLIVNFLSLIGKTSRMTVVAKK